MHTEYTELVVSKPIFCSHSRNGFSCTRKTFHLLFGIKDFDFISFQSLTVHSSFNFNGASTDGFIIYVRGDVVWLLSIKGTTFFSEMHFEDFWPLCVFWRNKTMAPSYRSQKY